MATEVTIEVDMSEWKRATWKKWAIAFAVPTVTSVLFVGVLHTSLGRPLLMRLGGCPISIAPQADVEKARREALERERGAALSPEKLALGFMLSSTTLHEVEAWADANGLPCKRKREDAVLVCNDVPARAFKASLGSATASEVLFSFRLADKKLLSVSVWRYGLAGDAASTELGLLSRGLKSKLGEPQRDLGGRGAADLTASAYATTVIDYKFRDYTASVSTTNIPGKGVELHEEYLAID